MGSDGDRQAARRFVVRGRVQGVGFRAFTWRAAVRLGLSGWVRNRRDGSVEVVAAGPEAALEALAAELRRGPGAADVTGVAWQPLPPEEVAAGFSIGPDA